MIFDLKTTDYTLKKVLTMLDAYIIAGYNDVMTIAFFSNGKLYDIVAGKADYMMAFLEELYEGD